MTHNELIEFTAAGTTCTKAQVKIILRKALHAITRELIHGGTVRLTDFGTFAVTNCAERKVTNPRTREPVIVPAHKRPIFRPGKALKEAVQC